MPKRIILFLISLAFLLLVIYFLLSKRLVFDYSYSSPFNCVSGSFENFFYVEMEKNGLDREKINCLEQSLKNKVSFSKLGPKDSYSIYFSTSGDFRYLEIYKSGEVYSSFYSNGKCISKKSMEAYETEFFSVSGEIKGNLWTSMNSKKIPPSVILQYTDIFSWTVDFLTEVRDNDKFSLFYEERKTKSGKITGYKISAALYEGRQTGRNIAVEFNGSYYNQEGKGARSFFLRAPLNYRRISSYFSHKRYHPVLKYVRPHLGIDYAAAYGTPVSSVADGRISFVGNKGGYGKFVEITHPYGYITTYGHLSKFSQKAKIGMKVSQGDVIGYVGATGIATGPHLDFRVKQNGKFLNYLKIKNKSSTDLPPKYKKEFLDKVSRYFPSF